MSLSKRSKVIISILVIGMIAAFIVYKYSMQPPEQIETRKSDFTGSSDLFLSEVQKDFSVWQDKVVILEGTITNSDSKGVTLSNQIYCQLREDVQKIQLNIGQNIKLKGRVIGYDDLLEELKLDQCIIQP